MDLWTEASADVEGERAALRMANAKVAVAGLWPFLALAQSGQEFEHRLALATEHIAKAVPGDLFGQVVESLRADFLDITAAKDAEGEESADDEDGDGKPDWLQEKIDKSSSYYHAGLGRWVAWGAYPDPEDQPTRGELEGEEYERQRQQTHRPMEEDDDPDEEAYWRSLGDHVDDRIRHGAYWHAGRQAWVPARLAAVEEGSGGGNPHYFDGGPEAGPATGMTNQFAPAPVNDPVDPINGEFPMQPSAWTVPPGGEWKEEPMSFSPPTNRATSRLAVAVGDTDVCANCRIPVKAVKVSYGNGVDWTHTGPHGFEADDHHQPVPERLTRNATWKAAVEGVEGRPGPNPNFFSGGGEGATGDPQSGFVPDVAKGVDPDDRVNELYGQSPISGGEVDFGNRVATFRRRAELTPDNPAPDSDKLQGTEFDSPQERSRWNIAQDEDRQQGNRDSTALTGVRHTANPALLALLPEIAGAAEGGAAAGAGAGAAGGIGRSLMGAVPGMIGGGGGGEQQEQPEEDDSVPRQLTPGSPVRASRQFFDPSDPSVQMVATGPSSNPFGGGNPFAGGPDQSMNTNPFGADNPMGVSNVPQTTPPRQMPGSAGGPPSTADQAPSDQASKGELANQAMRHRADSMSRDLPTVDDPTGLGDEYREKTIDGPLTTRPRQSAEHRNVNTPQKPQAPIPTVNSNGGQEQNEREAARRVAARAIKELVGA